jgi:hypothetical protein
VLVYGDQQQSVSASTFVRGLEQAVRALSELPAGLPRHQALVEAFIDYASLVQGLADREYERAGRDELSALQQGLMSGLVRFAGAVERSWRSGFETQASPDLDLPEDPALPESVTLKRCEGYAFYGLYPEAYLEAARGLPEGCVVIGLRSIGTGLAALAAAACGAERVFTLRPGGHPFSRAITAGPKIEAFVRENSGRTFVIADEGPGLSGSSFGGTADWLEGLGVERERIVFMPSHDGALGPQARAEHRARWDAAERRVRSFEALFTAADAPAPLQAWFADITGDLVTPMEDISGGAWRSGRAIPAWPGREARKYRLRGRKGDFLAKFAGIDRAAREKFGRARALHAAGFCAEPLALRYGFIIEPFVEGAPPDTVPVQLLSDYLAFRRERFACAEAGASLEELVRMSDYNLGSAGVARDLSARWSAARLERLRAAVVPVHVDARLHAWEWLQAGGRILKADALDHSQAHDLVGCQDILWDVAGAIVELDSPEAELAPRFTGGDPERCDLLEMMKLCYLGFQLGWWSMSGTAEGEARSRWYAQRGAALLGGAAIA